MAVRIEVYEKYPLNGDVEERAEYYANLKIAMPEEEYGYRRTMPMVEMIDRPIEIVGNKNEFLLLFWSGEQMTVLGNYDDFCIELNDIEMGMVINDILDEIEIEKEDV